MHSLCLQCARYLDRQLLRVDGRRVTGGLGEQRTAAAQRLCARRKGATGGVVLCTGGARRRGNRAARTEWRRVGEGRGCVEDRRRGPL